MKRRGLAMVGLAALMVVGMAFASVAADSMPASKATALAGDIHIIDNSSMDWTSILSTQIKTSNQKDLFVDVSLESGLYTNTKVASKDMIEDKSVAQAGIEVQVLIDGVAANPGSVIFNDRTQTLTATLQGQLEWADNDGDGQIDDIYVTNPEEIGLILSTMSANSFNFILADVPAGVHTIDVQAKIQSKTSSQNGTATASATIGKGSVTVESVRMIKDLMVELP